MMKETPLATLLDELTAFIRRFVSLSQTQADACALWILHTHALEGTDFTPYINITSPLPRSGKTTLLQLLSMLAAKAWYTGRVTAAVLIRKTDQDHPTLLLDESDAAFSANREYAETLRGVLNTGYERDGRYSMCVQVKKDWLPRDFSTFSPKVIAGIGKLPDTVEDRSIPISLKRKLPSEECESFRKRKVRPEADPLRVRAAKWASRNIKRLGEAEPDMPRELNDRQQDVCESLIAIADLAGEEWPTRARQALTSLFSAQADGDVSVAVTLLADIRACFGAGEIHDGHRRITTVTLLQSLNNIDESPWGEFNKGYALTMAQLARLLKPFEIRPRDLRFKYGVFKGYEARDFQDAWSRYLEKTAQPAPSPPGSEGQQAQQTAVHAGSSDFSQGQQAPSVAPNKNAASPVNMRVVSGVAPVEPLGGSCAPVAGPTSATLAAAVPLGQPSGIDARALEAITHVCKHRIRKR